MRRIGFNVGHEKLLENGISSWMWAVNCQPAPYGDSYSNVEFSKTIVLIRKPEDVVASLAFKASECMPWMRHQVGGNAYSDLICEAASLIVSWTDLAIKNRRPDYIVKTEYFPEFCKNTFGKLPDVLPGVNARKHRSLNSSEMKMINLLVLKYNEFREIALG